MMRHTKKIFTAILAVQLLMAAGVVAQAAAADATPVSPSADVSTSSDEPVITPRKDYIVWRYKTIDGCFYRRQYNQSKQEWIGDWERC